MCGVLGACNGAAAPASIPPETAAPDEMSPDNGALSVEAASEGAGWAAFPEPARSSAAGSSYRAKTVQSFWRDLSRARQEPYGFRRYGYLLTKRQDAHVEAVLKAIQDGMAQLSNDVDEQDRARYAVTFIFRGAENAPDSTAYDIKRAGPVLRCFEGRLGSLSSTYLVAAREAIGHCGASCASCQSIELSVLDFSGVPIERIPSWVKLYERLMRDDVDWVGRAPGSWMENFRDQIAKLGEGFTAAVSPIGVVRILWTGAG